MYTCMVINFLKQIVNRINMTLLLNDEQRNFLIKNINLSRIFNYLIELGRNFFNYDSFLKSSLSTANYACKCNDSAYKSFIHGDHGHIITGNLNIVNDLNFRNLWVMVLILDYTLVYLSNK